MVKVSDAIAFGSLVIAFWALGWSIKTHKMGLKLNQRDLFLSLHEQLSRPEQVRGRTILREEITSETQAKAIRTLRPDKHESVMSAIIMLDILAMYVEKGYVGEDHVLEEWGWLYGRCFEHGKYVISELQWYDPERRTRSPWQHFAVLGEKASEQFPVGK
ncbi:hypothetical protein [Streptomyces antimycoticus]|uniref:hypothetical protein n=1 Tax=Streptomyces antimycoticus TaxID=68175 RepID=UPI00117FBC16|nr:hypothetical protein [Streptomyces antimycoticus]